MLKNKNKIFLANKKGNWQFPDFLFDGRSYVVDVIRHHMKNKHNLDVDVGGIMHTHKDKGLTHFIQVLNPKGKAKNGEWVRIEE